MTTVMVIFSAIILGLLVGVGGVVPRRSAMSQFELERRATNNDKKAIEILRRESLLIDILSLQRIISALLLVIFVLLSVAAFGWLLGIVVAIVIAVEYGAIARLPLWQRRFQGLYERYEAVLLGLVERSQGALRFLRTVVPDPTRQVQFNSREELEHLVKESGTLLSSDEKKLIVHGLTFNTRRVNEILIPRGMIDSISKKELLGPLVLDDLHKTGHSRFPVIDGDIDHIVGMLHIRRLLTLDVKRSVTAEKAMEPCVYYIHEDQTLQHALVAFIQTRHHLFVVVNEFRETVGILSLEDVIEALLGRKIVDEFDKHDDLRAVAMRNPRGNNHPNKREDV